MDSENYQIVFGKFTAFKSELMTCGVVEIVKHTSLRRRAHLERMEEMNCTDIENVYK